LKYLFIELVATFITYIGVNSKFQILYKTLSIETKI
jgi:hypothetical protein